MADEVDLEELFESMVEGETSASSKIIKHLKKLWDEEEFEEIEIFAEEVLTDETPKDFIAKILKERTSNPEFVEDFVASIDGKRIVQEEDFPTLIEFTTCSRESDNEEFNASRSGRASAALNPDCPLDLLSKLAEDEKWEIRYRVALNPSSTSDLLNLILKGSYPAGLEFLSEFLETTIALHKNADTELLKRLANSENQTVRTGVACNPSASAEVVKYAKSVGIGPELVGDSRLCWWFADSAWTLADLENLQIR
jgi:hypothetical protein